MTKSQKQLLWIAAILAALQFVVKPVLSWQAELITETQLNLDRLARSEQLLDHADELAASAAAAETARIQLREQFPVAIESSMLQIQLQGELETLLRSKQVRVEQFNWVTGLEPINNSLQGIRAKIMVSGGLQQLIQAHYALMQEMPTAQHESIEIRQANTRRSGYRLSLTVFIPVQRSAQAGGQS